MNQQANEGVQPSSLSKSILYVAYHYPPILISSGSHRTLTFTRHLCSRAWDVRVLTTSLKAYQRWSADQLELVPSSVQIIRGYARNVAQHFSWKGKYFSAMALPDNWQSWILGGTISGLWAIFTKKPDIIVSTYPIASAHVIAYLLHRASGVPWVADLRDPMAQPAYPSDHSQKKWFEWIERKIVQHCKCAVVTAPGAKSYYEQKYPATPKDFWQVIPNGFDEETFPNNVGTVEPANAKRRRVLLHSGVIYPSERDPTALFYALSELKSEGLLGSDKLEVRLRATGHDAVYAEQIAALGIADIVSLRPTIPYKEALTEMLDSDALLLLQAENCNFQIPAKAYEYLRARKPILALTPEDGDTGKLLSTTGMVEIAPLDNGALVKAALLRFLGRLNSNEFAPLSDQQLLAYSRQHRSREFELLLDRALSQSEC